MPASTYLALFLVLVLYTYAVFGMRRGIRLGHCVALIAGVVLDGVASAIMVARSSGSPTIHGVIGAISWLLMLILAIAVLSVKKDNALLSPGMQRGFWRAGIVFYAVWLLSLVTGYATHVAAVDRSINLIGG